MKKLHFLYILLTLSFLANFSTVNAQVNKKKEDSKKVKQEESKKLTAEELKKIKLEEPKKLSAEELKKLKPEELKKLKEEELKKQKITDSVKIVKVVTEETTNDTTVIYNGKFKPYKKKAHASYYHDKFHGKRTASGKKYDKNKLTAAHKKLPFGSKVKVTNESTGKSVVVEVTDRGPFVKGREIDLSRKAFTTIAGGSRGGSINVTLEVLQE